MKISEIISVLEQEMRRLGDREVLEGQVFGPAKPFVIGGLLSGEHLPKSPIRGEDKFHRFIYGNEDNLEVYGENYAILYLRPIVALDHLV